MQRFLRVAIAKTWRTAKIVVCGLYRSQVALGRYPLEPPFRMTGCTGYLLLLSFRDRVIFITVIFLPFVLQNSSFAVASPFSLWSLAYFLHLSCLRIYLSADLNILERQVLPEREYNSLQKVNKWMCISKKMFQLLQLIEEKIKSKGANHCHVTVNFFN